MGNGHYEKEMDALRGLYEQGVFVPSLYSSRLSGIHDFDNYESFTEIPFMYKDDIRKTKPFERTSAKPGEVYGLFSSSGTTGDKTFYVYSKKDKKVHEEFVNTFFSEIGINETDIGGVFAPVDTGVMAHTMMWQFTTRGAGYVNCPVPSPENMIHVIQSVPVTVIATRPSVVSAVAGIPEYAEIARKSSVRILSLGGGFLSKARRKLLEDTWGAECYNMFGMSEMFGPMAGECRQKNGQHYLDKYLMIEVVDPVTKKPVEPGETGIAVYTTLWEKGFPLLRYWTDDLMWIETGVCGCGSSLPKLHYRGRMADCFVIDGQYVFPEQLENIIIPEGFVYEYRAEQKPDSSITVYLEKREDQEVTPQMKDKLRGMFHTDPEIVTVNPGGLHYPGHGAHFIRRA